MTSINTGSNESAAPMIGWRVFWVETLDDCFYLSIDTYAENIQNNVQYIILEVTHHFQKPCLIIRQKKNVNAEVHLLWLLIVQICFSAACRI